MDQAQLMEEILEYWRQSDAFKKSIDSRSPEMRYKFYDGPPFTSGDPHYGHLLQSAVKDMVPRWMTMRGYRVERRWGWDCHGIPAENFVNKQLGITSRKQVEEEFGIQNYVEECRSMVNNVNDAWKWFVDHVGRWADMENAYFTMDNSFMESVIRVFSELYNQNLIYKGFKVLGYSWALGTALSASEIAEGYEDRQDPAVTIRFPIQHVYDEEHPHTDDGFVEVVSGVVRDEKGRFLMVHHQKSGNWEFAGGKVHEGEYPADALKREMKEELGIDVTHEKLVGFCKIVYCGKLYRFHYYDVEYTGEPTLQEADKHHEIKWVEQVDFENELGYAVKVDGVVIDDVAQLKKNYISIYLSQKVAPFAKYDEAPMSFLAWTTTPWTLPSNMFLAVNKDLEYKILFDPAEKEYFILASKLVGSFYKNPQDYIEIYTLKGEELLDIHYVPLFDFYYKSPLISPEYHSQVHRVLAADFISDDSGTGIAHQAPAFGEDDYNLVAQVLPRDKPKEWLLNPLNDHGEFTSEIPDWEGENVIASNKPIIQRLKDDGRLVKLETINHSYPHCPRTGEPLIYRAIESRFVKEQELTAKTVPSADDIHFVPDNVKSRFINGLETAPDWNISRTRFRGTPLPIRECLDCNEHIVCGTIAEIEEKSGQKVDDLHRPYIDEITMPCPSCGKQTNRIPEVLDCWFESGSMPYGQDHYLGEKSEARNAKREITAGYVLTDNLPMERLEEFRALRLETLKQEPEAFGHAKHDVEQEKDMSVWEERLQKGYKVFVEHEGNLVGQMRADERNDRPGVGGIFSVYVNNQHRRKGLGGVLLDACLTHIFEEKGLSSAYLRVDKDAIKAQGLYESRGFKNTGVIQEDVLGEIKDLILYELTREQYIQRKSNLTSGFNNKADFIAEGLDQTRGWFRSLHVLGTAVSDQRVFDHCVVTGMVLAEDGKKMSKSKKNYPDPSGLLKQYGGDAFRLYVMNSPVVRAEPLRFMEKGVEQVLKDVLIPVQNVYNFFATYAEVDGWKHPRTEIYMMRHADAIDTIEEPRTKETGLTDKGIASLESHEFVEKVLRIQPEVIYHSGFKRAELTALGAAAVMKKYLDKDIPVLETEHGFGGKENRESQEKTREIWQKKVASCAGKRALVVSHKQWIQAAMRHVVGLETALTDNLEVVKMPLGVVANELDQWILAETHKLVLELDGHMSQYHIESATRVLMDFVDKLTNRYVRRSRRRFRGEGMNADKSSAYATLFEVLQTYLKVLAPFAPFTTEKVWLELQRFVGTSGGPSASPQDDSDASRTSIHLQYWPIASDKYINEQLIEEIATVRKVIKGAMYLRAKHQIKVKQPLQSLEVKL